MLGFKSWLCNTYTKTNESQRYALIYLNIIFCRLPNMATRATLFNCEALKSKSLYNEAAVQYIKMTSEVNACQ